VEVDPYGGMQEYEFINILPFIDRHKVCIKYYLDYRDIQQYPTGQVHTIGACAEQVFLKLTVSGRLECFDED
jgi:hypothetical protein